MRRLLAALLAGLALPCAATTVMVTSIVPGRVDLLINGSVVRSLRAGEVSPEGVRVLEVGRDAALVEVDGRRWSMRLGSSTASSVVLQADPRGHFYVTAHINGMPVQAVVDTGATTVAMSRGQAQRLGLGLEGARPIRVETAGGIRRAWLIRVSRLQVGDIVLQDVEVGVSESEDPRTVLLGMSFLNRVDMQRSGTTMTLTQRH